MSHILFDDNYQYFKSLIYDIFKFAKGKRIIQSDHTYNTIKSLINLNHKYMQGKIIIITGGSGLIGKSIIRLLIDKKNIVVNFHT